MKTGIEFFWGLGGGVLELVDCGEGTEGGEAGEGGFLLEGAESVVMFFDAAATMGVSDFMSSSGPVLGNFEEVCSDIGSS